MKTQNEHRLSIIKELLDQSKPLNEIIQALSLFDWDYEGPKMILSKFHIENALGKFIKSELVVAEIENWANCIEGREDIEFEHDGAALIDSTLFELANPALTQELNVVRAQQLVRRLREE
jgi:hypothetical protein